METVYYYLRRTSVRLYERVFFGMELRFNDKIMIIRNVI